MKVYTKFYPFFIICLFLISISSVLASYKIDEPINVLGVNLTILRGESQIQRNKSMTFQPIPRLMNNTSIPNLNWDHENNSFRYSSKIHESYSLPSWGGIGFEYRKNITIYSSKVSADLTNFPLVIDLRDATDIFGATQPSGNDIMFTDASGSKLDHELELFDRGTSHLVAWVRLPSLSSSIDTQISIYYGNQTVGNQHNPTGVWDNNYMAVWHLTGDPSSTIIDSTSNNNYGSAYGTVLREEGVMGYGYNFDQSGGVDDYLQIPQSSSISLTGNQMTLEGWIYLPYTPVPYDSMVFDKAGSNYDYEGYMMGVDGGWTGGGDGYPTRLNRRLNTDIYGNIRSDDGQIYPGKWTYIAAVYNGTQSFFAGYIDAVLAHSESISGNIINTNMDLFVARRDEPTSRMFYGSTDELRISNVSRSTGYLTTAFNNYNDPDSFYSVGVQEPWAFPAYKYRRKITIDSSLISGSNDLQNFPLLINISVENLYGNVIFANESTGERFDYDIELIDPNYNLTHSHLVAWVNIPKLSPGKDVDISMYYGTSTINGGENSENLWEDYVGVWHLGETVTDEGTASYSHIDESPNNNDGNQTGNDEYEGVIGRSQDFDGDDYINFGDTDTLELNGDSYYTFSGWFHRDSTSNTHTIFNKWYDDGSDGTGYALWINHTDGSLYFRTADDDDDGFTLKSSSNFNSLPIGWYHFAITFHTSPVGESTPDDMQIYINGVDDNAIASLYGYTGVPGSPSWDGNDDFDPAINLADFTISNISNPFDGQIDEIRIIEKLLPEDWIRTEYRNQYNLSLYLTMSGEEENSNWWREENFVRRKDFLLDSSEFQGIEEEIIIRPGARGYLTQFSRNSGTYNYEAVDETIADSTTYLYHQTNNTQLSEFFYPVGVPQTPEGPISSIRLYTRARRSGSLQSYLFEHFVRIGGTDYSMTTRSLGTSFYTSYDERTTNPATNQPWTWEDLKNLEFGVKADLTMFPTTERIEVTQVYLLVKYIRNTPLYSFPIFLDIYDNDLKTDVQPNGNDIKFVDEYGQKLAHEIVEFDQNFNSSHSHLAVWAKIPLLSTDRNTFFSMYYGNESIGLHEDPEGTWNENYLTVYHLEESPTGTLLDSTSNNYDLTSSGTMSAGDLVSGMITNAIKFDGINDQLFSIQSLSLQDFTVSAWINFDTGSNWRTIINVDRGTSTFRDFAILNDRIVFDDGSTVTFGSALSTTTWYHVVYTYDYDLDELKCYINGVQTGSTTFRSISSVTDDFQIGAWATTDWFDGIIDELRILNISQSANWAKAQYINQFSPTTTLSVGVELDHAPPVINNFGVDDPGDGNPVFWADVTDSDSSVSNVMLRYNQTYELMTQNLSGLWTYHPEDISYEEFYTFQVINASDINGNLAAATVERNSTFDKDNVNPTILDWEYFADMGSYGTFKANITDTWGIIDTVTVNVTYHERMGDLSGLNALMRFDGLQYINDTIDMISGQFKFTVTATDTKVNTITSTEHSGYVTNIAPRVDSVSLSLFENNVTLPINSSSTMYINHTFFDEDGDIESGSLIKWFKWNSTSTLWVLQDAYSNQKSVPKTVLFKGDIWRASYRPKDGIEFGNEEYTSNVTIQNSAPYVTNVIIDPGSPKAGYNLSTSYDWFDEDPLDSEASPQIRWYRDNGNGSGLLLLSTYNNQAILSSSVTRKNDDWQYSITPSDGFDNGVNIFSNIVTIQNTPPTFLNLTINGFNVTKQINDGDDLAAGFTYYDVDNEENSSVDTFNNGLQNIRWYENGIWVESLNDQTTVDELNTDIGEWWQFAINISDGTEYGDWVFSPSVWIETDPNIPPIAENVTIAPSNPIAGDTLFIDWDYNDSDGDLESASTYQWYKNGFYQPQFDGLQTLFGADLKKGDLWYAKVRPRDGIDFGEWNVSESVIIGNTPPVVQTTTTFPTFTTYTSNTIIIDYTASDVDNDPVTEISIRWFNGSIEVTSLANSTELPSSMTKKGQTWNYHLRVYDNLNWSIEKDSDFISILNSNPIVENITLTGGMNTFDNITVSYDYYDVDNDPEDEGQTTITWYIIPTNFTGFRDIENLSYEKFEAGYYVYAKVKPHDGSDFGSEKQAAYYIIVGNYVPAIIGTPNILGPNNSSSYTAAFPLYANYSAYDPDEGIVGYDLNIDENGYVEDAEYRWYRENELVSALTGPIVPISYLFRNDNWTFGVRPRDIYGDFGEWENSTKITIGNSLPEILRFEDINPIITTEDDLPIKLVYFDYDGDPIDESELLIRWYNNGTLISGTANRTILSVTRIDGEIHVVIKLSHQYYNKNDNITVLVHPFDGTDWAKQSNTSHVIRIANSIPKASNIVIKPNGLDVPADANDILNLTWSFDDLDNDSEIGLEMIIRWFRGINEIDTYANWTYVPEEAILKDQTWRAIIQVYDGEDYSLPYYSDPIIILNSPRVIFGVEVSNNVSELFADQTLLLDPYQDIISDDIDNDPVIDYLIDWYRNNSVQPSFENETLILSTELMKGDSWYAVIRLYDGVEWSENHTSQTIAVINKPPEILEILLEKNEFDDFLVDDENVTINVDFYDIDESDSDKSLVKWFVNGINRTQYDDDRIISSSETNPGDIWTCEVTPFDGFHFGTPVNFSIHIESRPEISEFNILTKQVREGIYQLSVKVVDAINNTITSVRYQIFLNGSSFPAINSILYSPNSTDYWILDFELQDYSLLNTPCLIRVTASSTVEYSDFFNIPGESVYNITLVDGAAPRVISAHLKFDDAAYPTNITFIAEVQEFGTGIDKVVVYYIFSLTNTTGGAGASIIQEVHEANMEFQNRTGDTFTYSVTVEFPQEQTNIEIQYRIATQDLDGNVNSNAFDNSGLPDQYVYPPPGLPEWMLYVAAFIIFITFVGSIVYVKFIRKPEVRGLDKDLVMEGVTKITEGEIMNRLDSHTIGIVVSFFHQAHGPIPIICVPELLRDNWSKLMELSDRAFSGTQFSDDFSIEIVSNYDFILDRGLHVSVMSLGYSLDRPEARGGQENITENILIHKEIFPLLNQFQEEIQPFVHKTHDLMNREPDEKQKITQSVLKLRKHLTAIVLSYEKIYGTTELVEEED